MNIRALTRHLLVLSLAGSCMLSSCRSTLYKAALRNDIQVVQQEIQRGADINDELNPLATLVGLPFMISALCIDITLFVGTLSLYAQVFKTAPLTQLALDTFSNTATEGAYFRDHYAMAAYLMNQGGKASETVRMGMQERGYQPGINPSALNTETSALYFRTEPVAPAQETTPVKKETKKVTTKPSSRKNTGSSSTDTPLPTGQKLSTPGN